MRFCLPATAVTKQGLRRSDRRERSRKPRVSCPQGTTANTPLNSVTPTSEPAQPGYSSTPRPKLMKTKRISLPSTYSPLPVRGLRRYLPVSLSCTFPLLRPLAPGQAGRESARAGLPAVGGVNFPALLPPMATTSQLRNGRRWGGDLLPLIWGSAGKWQLTARGFTNPERGRSGCVFSFATDVTEREGWAKGQPCEGTAVANSKRRD